MPIFCKSFSKIYEKSFQTGVCAPRRRWTQGVPLRRCVPALPKGEVLGMNLSVTFGDTSPGRRGLGRPGKPCCPHRPTWAQSSGPCSHWQRLRDCALTKGAGQAPVNLDSGARSFPIAENFARPAQPSPTRQWLPYQGSWHREAMTERLYYMARFRFALPFSGRLSFVQPLRHLR